MFWFTAAVSVLVAAMELALAFAVSLLGVALATPEALVQIKPVRLFLELCPPAAPYLYNQRALLSGLLLCIVLALLIKMGFSLYMYWKQGQFAQKIGWHITHVLFEGYLYGSYLWHAGQETSLLQVHLTWGKQIATFVMESLLALTYVAIALLLLVGVLATTPVIGLFVLPVTGFCGFFIYRWARHRIQRLSASLAKIDEQFNRTTLPALQGIREVIIYRQQSQFLALCDDLMNSRCRIQPRLDMLPPLPPMALEFVGMAMLLASLLYMNAQGNSLAHITATLTLMAAVAWRLLPTVNRFLGCLLNAQATLPYIQPVLARIGEVRNFGNISAITAESCPLNTEISLCDVSFRYPETSADKPDSLRHVSLTIRKGQKIGIIGKSGAGKSTLVGLLTGLFVPTHGSISVNGRKMTPELRAGWMQGIGYVPQSTFLLNASIAQNVAFSHWGAPMDQERIQLCCRMAAMNFLKDLPDGVDTIIGERGIRLSGGQAQRISIARALYNRPHTLILDEATSALDGVTEQEIMQAILELDKSITVIIIAHRLSTIEQCDKLFWLRHGTIAMHGSTTGVMKTYKAFLASEGLS